MACRLALLGIVLPVWAYAGAFGVVPYVEIGAQRDNNLFRVEDGGNNQAVNQSGPQSDTITRTAVGAAAEWPIARQKLLVGGEYRQLRYSEFDQLDTSENEVRAELEFSVGPAVTGALRYRRERRQDDFDNLDGTQTNFVTETNPNIEVLVSITPSWRVLTKAGHLRLDQTLPSQQAFNFREDGVSVEVQHLGVPGSILGVGVEYQEGEFPDRAAGGTLSQDFTQTTGFVTADWRYSGLSTFRGRLGYTQRDNSGGGGDRDFEGITGQFAYLRELTGKTNLQLEIFRQIFSVDDIDANFVEETGTQALLRWTYSTNLGAQVRYRYANQDYQTLAGATDNRVDKLSELAAELIFQPFRVLSFIFDLTFQDRDSNDPGESFDAIRGGMALRLSLDTD